MGRYINEYRVNTDPQIIFATISQFLQLEGYRYTQYEGENVFQKGNGFMTGPTFFKFSFSGNIIRMETWMKYALFPGIYIGEFDVTGFIGCAAKGPWKKRINYIENTFYSVAEPNTYTMNGNYAGPVGVKAPVYCNKCGNQIPEGAQFCTVCGQKRFNANVK